MATQNSINLKVTNNADGYDVAGGTTARKLIVTGADITLTGSGANVYTFPASSGTLMTNPMTTQGDVIYGGTAGAGTRLAIGTAGKVLAVNAGATAPEWVAAGAGDMILASIQTVTGAKTFGSAGAVGKLIIAGTTSGTTILDATAVAGAGTVTLPTTGTLATLAGVETLTNKSISGGQITSAVANATLAANVTTNANLTGGVTSVGNAATVVTNANLTGGVTSVGNAATVITNANLTGGVTSVGNAATVITNANLTGIVTSVGNATAIADGAIAPAKLTATTAGYIIVGAVTTGIPTYVAMSGDITIASTGATAIGSGVIVNTDINTSAAIALTKLAATTVSRALVSDAGGLIVASTTTAAEIGFVAGVTSAIQTQLNGKAASLSGTINEITYFASATTIGSLAVATYPSLVELAYVKGVTSVIQTQLNAKQGTLTNSAGLLAALSDETGSGLAVFNTSPTLVTPLLGTPTSGNLTNCAGLPIATGISGLGTGVATALAVNNNDAGGYSPIDGTATLTNKRINPRIVSAASYTTDTGTSLNGDTTDMFIITAQAGALLFNNPIGTPVQGQKLIIRIKDNATARALTYGTQFRASSDLALPSTTILSKTLYMGFIFNITDTKWDLLAVLGNI